VHARYVDTKVERGDDVRAQFAEAGGTALHFAARMGHVEIVRLLLRMGGDALARNAHGNTPLHSAVVAGHAETVKMLVEEFGLALLLHRMQVESRRYFGLMLVA
jgi:ankyrin repeat protein